MTVTGPVAADQLGVTLPHEHLYLDAYHVSRGAGLLTEIPLLVREVQQFKEAGGTTIVEVSSLGLGRNPEALRQIARRTGVNIVMGCGWYQERYYEPRFYEQTTNEMAAAIVRDLTEGVGENGIRSGIIGEIGSDRGRISPAEERSFRAAARAHRVTNVTITTHADYSPIGLAQLDLLEEEGVPAHRVIIGHCDSHPDPDYHLALAQRGAFVQFDGIRGNHWWDTASRMDLISQLAERGFLHQILLSQDVCCRNHLGAYGGPGFTYVIKDFVNLLYGAGFSAAQIHTLLVENPRFALTGVNDATSATRLSETSHVSLDGVMATAAN
jgi:phosphotriesterase-related protein